MLESQLLYYYGNMNAREKKTDQESINCPVNMETGIAITLWSYKTIALDFQYQSSR